MLKGLDPRNFLTFTNFVWEFALVNFRVNTWLAKNMSAYILCNKLSPL